MKSISYSAVLGELKKRFGDEVFKDKPRNLDTALRLAYADMSRRATGHTETVQKECLSILNEVFETEPQFNSQDEFDNWHKETCECLKKSMLENGFKGTYGRAQKVINMAFKYLVYTDMPFTYAHDYCHMTLDSYTLAWYKRSVAPKSNSVPWSKIDDYDKYLDIQKGIRSYLKTETPKCYTISFDGLGDSSTIDLPPKPFCAEYIIWEGEKVFEKYKDLIGNINRYYECGKDKDYWLMGDSVSRFLKDRI